MDDVALAAGRRRLAPRPEPCPAKETSDYNPHFHAVRPGHQTYRVRDPCSRVPFEGGVAVLKKLALVAICLAYPAGTAMAQDAKAVIANAQKALGDVRQSITYSGSAKDVSFQQCGANAAAMNCQGTHDPMRPITNYVRVIDLAAPASRHTGATNNIGAGGSTTVSPGHVLPAGDAAAGGRRRSRGPNSLEFYLTPWGFLKGAADEQRDREPAPGRRQELHRADLEPGGQGAVRQELRHQRLRERPEPRRARRDLARRQHHGRHAHRRHLHRDGRTSAARWRRRRSCRRAAAGRSSRST